MKEQLNIVITGKSGVGKSSFFNYLAGKEVFDVGDGSPVTQEYFEKVTYTSSSNIVYNLFDTKGIEPTTTDEHRTVILNKIEECDKSDNIFQWIHTVYYCFAASSKRIEPYEVAFIKELMAHVTVIVLLTKKDLVSNVDLANLKEQINREIGTKVQVIPVCSISEVTRKGTTVPEGKDDVLKASFLGLWNKLSVKLPDDIFSIFSELNSKVKFNNPINRNIWLKKFDKLEIYFADLDGFPDIDELGFKGLYSEDIDDFKSILSSIKELLHNFIDNLDDLFSVYWNLCKEVQDSVFSFYEKINGEKPKIIFSNSAEDKIEKIKNYLFENGYIQQIIKEISDLIREVDNVSNLLVDWIFNSDNRYIVRDKYDDITYKIEWFIRWFAGELVSFKEVYEAELLQYGQYCIRSLDDEVNSSMFISTESELSKDERKYLKLLRDSIENGKIDEKEREILDRFKTALDISDLRARLVEDFCRRNG